MLTISLHVFGMEDIIILLGIALFKVIFTRAKGLCNQGMNMLHSTLATREGELCLSFLTYVVLKFAICLFLFYFIFIFILIFFLILFLDCMLFNIFLIMFNTFQPLESPIAW